MKYFWSDFLNSATIPLAMMMTLPTIPALADEPPQERHQTTAKIDQSPTTGKDGNLSQTTLDSGCFLAEELGKKITMKDTI